MVQPVTTDLMVRPARPRRRWPQALGLALLAAATAVATTATPASATLMIAYANFDGLAPGGVCATEATPYTVVNGGWSVDSDAGSVEFCPGNLNASNPPDASHLEALPGTTTLQQDLLTNPIYTYFVSYTVGAVSDSVTTQVTVDGVTTQCVSDTSQRPATCDILFQPAAATASVTVTIPNSLVGNIEMDDLYVWVPA